MTERITLTFGDYSRSVDVPEGITNVIYDAFADAYKYQENVVDPDDSESTIPNPETKQDFTTKRIRIYVEQVLAGYNKKQAVNPVVASANASTRAILDAVVIDPV
jgi:hypothetical protein